MRARPVLFWIHGGGWRIGSPARRLDAKRELAARHRWGFASVGYRLSTTTSGVRWPDHGEDVAAAIAATLDQADELDIDPGHVAVMGHSAGGQLASIVTVDPDLLAAVGHDRDEIDCLVSLDTEGYDLTHGGRGPTALVEHAFGSDPPVLAQASPTTVLREEGGPVADALLVTRDAAPSGPGGGLRGGCHGGRIRRARRHRHRVLARRGQPRGGRPDRRGGGGPGRGVPG